MDEMDRTIRRGDYLTSFFKSKEARLKYGPIERISRVRKFYGTSLTYYGDIINIATNSIRISKNELYCIVSSKTRKSTSNEIFLYNTYIVREYDNNENF